MRINRFVAQAHGISRRRADEYIAAKRVLINGLVAQPGQQATAQDNITLDDKLLKLSETVTTILLNKPAGYVCSRSGQGSRTIYNLLPTKLHHLKPVGRLDKDSSGLILLTNDGMLANKLTHPSFQKTKQYEISLDKTLPKNDYGTITQQGVKLDDGLSKLQLKALDNAGKKWQVTMQEGRNRQIRRTFSTLGYNVIKLHRTGFGQFTLANTKSGNYLQISL